MSQEKHCLVVVESPTKMRTVAQALGAGFEIAASAGHVRDLPTSAGEVPAKYKGEKWARTGVNVDKDFEPIYVISSGKQSVIKDIKAKLARADELWLATDEDREGEAIAWHLLQVLKPKVPVKRLVFHEITRGAIAEATKHMRDLNTDKVDAQETRRILDRLYGYEVSPVLWKKVMPKLSAGRVQSVATRLVVDRERERRAFTAAEYAGIDVELDAGADADPRTFTAALTYVGDLRLATGRDFDTAGKLSASRLHLDLAQAQVLAAALPSANFSVESVEAKAYRRSPYAPFRTTTLQQEAGRKLGFTAQRTMSVAQGLYERGFITYMRTDSVTLSTTAVAAARAQVEQLFGADYLPPKPRLYQAKVKNAQEAHEAIRPAGDQFQTPQATGLRGDDFRLYELIWKRTLASQMKDAQGNAVTVKVNAATEKMIQLVNVSTGETGSHHHFTLQANGRTITILGFLAAYVESVDDGAADDQQSRIPQLQAGAGATVEKVEAAAHQTLAPKRYTEESLIETLESLSIGRPSTYASIISTITSRDYIYKKGRALVPTWLAFAVTKLLEEHFANLVDYAFTAEMEQQLDEIETGEKVRKQVLHDFYFGDSAAKHEGLSKLVNELGEIDARRMSTFEIGDDIVVRVGRYGTYVENSAGDRANVPADLPPDELTTAFAKELLATPAVQDREVGKTEEGLPVVAKDGRFGPYVTEVLPPDAPKGAKPRTGSLFKTMSVDTVTLEQALALLSLPRVVGNAADGEEITAQNGRYGPYLKKGSESRSLAEEDQIFTVTLEEAQMIMAGPKRGAGTRAAAASRELGEDPATGGKVVVKS
ncbi:MAG: type I DNA topoisomerase, partial [Propionibacteriaceae bacterium]|nr:type I DNA topoisomerase [Propionibacteriaceae bacterium]